MEASGSAAGSHLRPVHVEQLADMGHVLLNAAHCFFGESRTAASRLKMVDIQVPVRMFNWVSAVADETVGRLDPVKPRLAFKAFPIPAWWRRIFDRSAIAAYRR